MVLEWRCDQNQAISGPDSGDSRLAKTRDHVQATCKNGSYASGGRWERVTGRRMNDVIQYNAGLQTGRGCDMIQSETVVCSGEGYGHKSTITAAPSSSGQYRHCGASERGIYIQILI